MLGVHPAKHLLFCIICSPVGAYYEAGLAPVKIYVEQNYQRIQKLTNLGILKGSEYVIDPEKIGYETCAYIGLYLKDPEQFDSVTEALKKIPEVVECHFTTGQYDMFIKIYAKNNHHLLSIIHDKLQPLGLARSETIISFNEAIKRQMPILNLADED